MSSTDLTFATEAAHRDWLVSQSALPRGFRVGTTTFSFTPLEVATTAQMTATVICLDKPTPDFALMFTKNAFPGAPVHIGRQRLAEPTLGAVVVNNKISNVCAPNGVATSEAICAATAHALGMEAQQVLPSSTGIIGWQLPRADLEQHIPAAVAALQADSILPAAEGIVTTDLYPKVRRVQVGDGSIVGIAKGAGMVEPNLATMLVYLVTDLQIPRAQLRELLQEAVADSFNCMSIDSDTSTSDTVALLSSGQVPCEDVSAFAQGLRQVCADLSEDVARNGEGVHHVVHTTVSGSPSREIAHGVAKAVANSPLVQCAICGNDPNVGRIVMAIGKYCGAHAPELDLSNSSISVGGELVFSGGVFQLDPDKEQRLHDHLVHAEMYASAQPDADGHFLPPVTFPPHEKSITIAIDLALGDAACTVIGTDRSHEYITENADYRS